MYTRLGSLFDDPPGDNLAVARKRAYAAADLISYNGMECREDIALRETVSSDHASALTRFPETRASVSGFPTSLVHQMWQSSRNPTATHRHDPVDPTPRVVGYLRMPRRGSANGRLRNAS